MDPQVIFKLKAPLFGIGTLALFHFDQRNVGLKHISLSRKIFACRLSNSTVSFR